MLVEVAKSGKGELNDKLKKALQENNKRSEREAVQWGGNTALHAKELGKYVLFNTFKQLFKVKVTFYSIG